MTTSNASTIEFISNSVSHTIQLGRQIGQALKGGEVIAVVGPLGSGKTCLIKGICMGCMCEQMDQVTSPTFVLVNEYHGRFTIYHIDAYRLSRPDDFLMLGFEELLGPGSVVVIEWADKVLSRLQGCPYVTIRMEHLGPESRKIIICDYPWDLGPSKISQDGSGRKEDA